MARVDRNARGRERRKQIRELGLSYSNEEISRMRYWSEERYQKEIKSKLKKKKRADYMREYRRKKKIEREQGSSLILQIFWRDRSEFTDDSVLKEVRRERVSIRDQIQNINASLSYNGGEIGETKIEVTNNPKQNEQYYAGEYYKQYEGNGSNYNKLLSAIAGIVAGTYYAFEKHMFMYELVQKMFVVNPKTAQRLQADFNLY